MFMLAYFVLFLRPTQKGDVCSISISVLVTYLEDSAHCNISVHNSLATVVTYQEAKVLPYFRTFYFRKILKLN